MSAPKLTTRIFKNKNVTWQNKLTHSRTEGARDLPVQETEEIEEKDIMKDRQTA